MKKNEGVTKGLYVVLMCALCIFLHGFAPSGADATGAWKVAPGLIKKEGTEPVLSKIIEENQDVISVQYSVPDPVFEASENQEYNGEVTERIILGNANLQGKPGEPMIPAIVSRVILPYGTTIKAVTVIPDIIIEETEEHLLAFGEIPHRLSAPEIMLARASEDIYATDAPFPAEHYKVLSIQDRCGVKIAIIEIYPLTYYPLSRRIEYYKTFTLEVETMAAPQKIGLDDLTPKPERLTKGIQAEENPTTLDSYNAFEAYNLNSAMESYSYVIVTNKAIINATTTPNLADFVNHKKNRGFTVKVEAIEDIKQNYSGSSDDIKLRNFLREAYNNWNTEYVLLGGDTNIIPLKTVSATNGGETDNLPTDLPYQCLSQSTWNDDFEAELYIGRVSAENATEFSNFVYKTIDYETSDANESYLKKVLGASEKLDNTTYAKESIDKIFGLFSSDFSMDSLADKTSTWSPSTLINYVNTNKYGVINHFGHSNTTIVMKLESGNNWNPSSFKNTNFIFAKSQGCIPGAFDRDCIAEHMTTSNRTGMFAVVFNSRYGWYLPNNPTGGPSHKVHYSFWEAYFKKGLKSLGQCNEYSHRMNTQERWDILESNLFGDPSIIVGETSAPPAEKPVAAFDAAYDASNSYKVNLTDKSSCDGCKITGYRWELGDGSTYDIRNPSHTYKKAGTYTIKLTVTTDQGKSDTASKDVTVPQGDTKYCASSSEDFSYEWIAEVTVGEVSKRSTGGKYSDFTDTVMPLAPGERNPIQLTPGFKDKGYAEAWRVWIDFNQDSDFDDAGEMVFEKTSDAAVSGSIDVPAGAGKGRTRMRVAMQYQNYANPCGGFKYGEIEDYTVEIGGSSDPKYCESKGRDQKYEWIAGVSVDRFENTSKAAGYSDFTRERIDVSPGATVDVVLTPGYSGQSYDEKWQVWIDWNRDGRFDGRDEAVLQSTGSGDRKLSLTIPRDATAGATRMRVSMTYAKEYPKDCGDFDYGETEDYTIVVGR